MGIKINPRNVNDFDEALKALRQNLKTLVEMTEKYPVECAFANHKFIFTSEADIRELIDTIETKLREYRSAA
jgi:hypothetical protein